MYLCKILEALLYAVLIFGVCSWLPLCLPTAIFVYVALNLYQRTNRFIQWDNDQSEQISLLKKQLEEARKTRVFTRRESALRKIHELEQELATTRENETWAMNMLEMTGNDSRIQELEAENAAIRENETWLLRKLEELTNDSGVMTRGEVARRKALKASL